ncbi:PEP-CTERM sorting domain-containing protein [Vibrio alginolyticus]|nr:PEP-CTERM sorting domain-containing protein [Vibrio alginolyticus]
MRKIIATLTLALSTSANASLVVTSTNDGVVLANTILGTGITVTNINVLGSSTQSGTFVGGTSSGLGINEGIILTSGTATDAEGPNSSDGTTTDQGGSGDSDLDSLIPQSTSDANVLEFDFTTETGDLFFNYVFASEEYNEYANSPFNDTFALFVDGVNYAMAPDGQVVSINNVNCGNPYIGVGPNCNSFNNNDLDDGGPFFDIEYDGFTDTFLAAITGLDSGTHTMKFAIADAGDSILDSAIFIKAGSFSGSVPTPGPANPIPEPTSLALFSLGLLGLTFRTKRKSSK